jgi:hypothetical protein
MTVFGQGWQPEQYFYGGGHFSPEGSCARFPYSNTTICVFERGPGPYNLDLYEIRSTDGGVTWSNPVQVTNGLAAEFDPFLAADPSRGRIWLLYSKNASPGNDLLIRHLACLSCSWSGDTVVRADGGNHWDASLTVLSNGHLLALESFEAYEGDPNGQIRSFRSTDGGYSWNGPTVIFDEFGSPEIYPVALQKSDGVIHLMFRDKAHGNKSLQIGQLWSSDSGYTWNGHSVFSNNQAQPRTFSFIGTQGGINLTVLASINGRVHHWTSWDNGLTWEGPYQTTSLSPSEDAEMSLGCRGPLFSFSWNYYFVVKRYDWYSSCQ